MPNFILLIWKEIINDEGQSSFDRAVGFYIVNKCSFSDLIESSSFSNQESISNFSMRGSEKLSGYSEIISQQLNMHIHIH